MAPAGALSTGTKQETQRLNGLSIPLLMVGAILLGQVCAVAQSSAAGEASPPPGEEPSQEATVFSHPGNRRFWISGQINLIFQGHPAFPAKYTGENTLEAASRDRHFIFVNTLYGSRIEKKHRGSPRYRERRRKRNQSGRGSCRLYESRRGAKPGPWTDPLRRAIAGPENHSPDKSDC